MSISFSFKSFKRKNIDNISHHQLRKLAIRVINTNIEHFLAFITDDQHASYVKNMSCNKHYGDEVTLTAIALYYGIKVIILRPNNTRNTVNHKGNPTVYLKYYGDDGDDAHYNPLIEISQLSFVKKSNKHSKSNRKNKPSTLILIKSSKKQNSDTKKNKKRSKTRKATRKRSKSKTHKHTHKRRHKPTCKTTRKRSKSKTHKYQSKITCKRIKGIKNN